MLVVERDFNQQIGQTFLSFAAGAVITSEGLERELVKAGAPVVVVERREDLLQCPHCRKLFTVSQAVDAEE